MVLAGSPPAGRATIAVCWVLYVGHFINTGHNPVFSVLLVLIGLWIPAAINLSGVKNMDPVVAGRRRPLGPL